MHITLTPQRRNQPLTLHRAADVLTLNGEVFDFGPLAEGAILPRAALDSDWFAADIERKGGALHLALFLPHGAEAPEETLFPAPLTLDRDGPVDLPPYAVESAT